MSTAERVWGTENVVNIFSAKDMENIFSRIKMETMQANLFKVVQQNMGRNWVILFVSNVSFCLL